MCLKRKPGITELSTYTSRCYEEHQKKPLEHKPHQNFSYIPHRTRKGNPKQKRQCWKYHNTYHQLMLQSHSNRNGMVSPQKQMVLGNRTFPHRIKLGAYLSISTRTIWKWTKDLKFKTSKFKTVGGKIGKALEIGTGSLDIVWRGS